MCVIDPMNFIPQSGGGADIINRASTSTNQPSTSTNQNSDQFYPTIQIIDQHKTSISNLGVDRIKIRIKFLNPPKMGDDINLHTLNNILGGWLERTFSTLLETIRARLNILPQDKVGISFARNTNDSFSISFRRFDQYNADVIISALSRVLQSNAEFLFDENLVVGVSQIHSDVGYGKRRYLEGIDIKSFVKAHNRSIVLIELLQGRETLCLAYALSLGIAHALSDINQFNRFTYKPIY